MVEYKRGHFTILKAIAEKGGLTNEDIKKVVGNRNLAVQYRRKLVEDGLIYRDEDGIYRLTASSWRMLYLYNVSKLIEDAVKRGNREFSEVLESGDIMVFEDGAPRFRYEDGSIYFGKLSEEVEKWLYQRPHDYLERITPLHALAFGEISRAAALLRRKIMEFRENMVLATLPEEKRKSITQYRKDLRSFLELCSAILVRRLKKMIKKLFEKLSKKELETLTLALEEGITYYHEDLLIRDRRSLITTLKDLYEKCIPYANRNEKAKLTRLYRRLVEHKPIDAFVKFLGEVNSLPRMVYIIPIGFKGYLLKFGKLAKEMAKKTGDKRLFTKFYEDILPYVNMEKILTPLLIHGIEEPTSSIIVRKMLALRTKP
ncbi:hypothetical protein DRO37_08805 [Candidatus Bathyarchaeota archaeon]|nr:MAG: hypothetical protein DRO37_08805 [Candidatus Bathyarchaeota archaeon]